MKTQTLKIVLTILMAIVVIMTCTPVFAAPTEPEGSTEGQQSSGTDASDVLSQITITNPDPTATQGLAKMAGTVLGLIRVASAIAAVILIAVFGFKFIMGSAQEKSDYQKSFIPLIVGVVVVFSATFIAELLFKTFA